LINKLLSPSPLFSSRICLSIFDFSLELTSLFSS
jgi:hypothetical protein